MALGPTGPGSEVVSISWSRAERFLVWTGFTLLGAGVGWLAPHLVGWLRDVPIGPFEGLADLVDRAPDGLVTPAALAIGALLGATLAGLGEWDLLRVRLTRDDVTLRRKDTVVTIPRRDVADVYLDGKRLVLLGPDGREQAGETWDSSPARLGDAFERMGYPWRPGGDPYAGDFRRWVPGMPGLPEPAGPLMVARQRALKRDDKDEARLLRAELSGAGVLVRDEKGQQHWRPIRTAGGAPGAAPGGGRPLRG